MKKIAAILGAIAVVSAGAAAHAHGKEGVHLKGVVKAVGETTLTLVATDKQEVIVKTSEKTQVMRGDGPSTLSEVRSGERVVVHAVKTKQGDLQAQMVKLAKAKRAPADPAKDERRASGPDGGDHGDHKH
jgi:hypothetical protein